MIAKRYRLGERSVKALLATKPTLHSQSWMGRLSRNRCGFFRLAIVLSGKVTRTSVSRNFFRRRCYDLSRQYAIDSEPYDLVITARKGVLDLKSTNPAHVMSFENDLKSLFSAVKHSPVTAPQYKKVYHPPKQSIPSTSSPDAKTLILKRLSSQHDSIH